MSETHPATPAGGRQDGGWDLRVVHLEHRNRWWWNAWHASTATELYGFADTRTDAWQAMHQAISTAPLPDQLQPGFRSNP